MSYTKETLKKSAAIFVFAIFAMMPLLDAGTVAAARNEEQAADRAVSQRIRSADEARAAGSTLQVILNDNGKAIVKGAKITGITGSVISAVTAFNSTNINWTVKTNDSTELYRLHDAKARLSEMQVGDYISFAGSLDTSATQLTVNANYVKDWSIQLKQATISGTILSINSGAMNFILTDSKNATTTVVVGSSTKLTRGDSNINFSNLRVGDKVTKASGLYNNVSRTLRADSVDVSAKCYGNLLKRGSFEGVMQSLSATSVPATMTIKTGSKSINVNIPSGVSVTNKRWFRIPLSSFASGDRVWVYGVTGDCNASSTLEASLVRNLSR